MCHRQYTTTSSSNPNIREDITDLFTGTMNSHLPGRCNPVSTEDNFLIKMTKGESRVPTRSLSVSLSLAPLPVAGLLSKGIRKIVRGNLIRNTRSVLHLTRVTNNIVNDRWPITEEMETRATFNLWRHVLCRHVGAFFLSESISSEFYRIRSFFSFFIVLSLDSFYHFTERLDFFF